MESCRRSASGEVDDELVGVGFGNVRYVDSGPDPIDLMKLDSDSG